MPTWQPAQVIIDAMQIRDLHKPEVESVRQFLCACGWTHRVGNPTQFALLISNTPRTAVAFEGQEIIGFARGITDGLSNGYLSMVVVSPEHQRQGVGRALVQHVMGNNKRITWLVRTGHDGASGFFTKLGFSTSSVAMERLRVSPLVDGAA